MTFLSTNHIELKDVSHSFVTNDQPIHLFKQLNLAIQQGQSYSLVGPSGSGKSSLLTIMSGLENPTSGSINAIYDNKSIKLSALRKDIGFIFQQFHLLPELTALNNVALPLKLRGFKNAEQQAAKWLKRVGLEQRINHKPKQLSGGEQQRVAIARALVFNPKYIFADEPTGNLDNDSAQEVADILFECCKERGAGLIIVTHSDELAARAEHIYGFEAGNIVSINHGSLESKYA